MKIRNIFIFFGLMISITNALSHAAKAETTSLSLKDGTLAFVDYEFADDGKTLVFKSKNHTHLVSIAVDHRITSWNRRGDILVLFDGLAALSGGELHHYAIPVGDYESEQDFFLSLVKSVQENSFERQYLHTGSGATSKCKACNGADNQTSNPRKMVIVGNPSPEQMEFFKQFLPRS